MYPFTQTRECLHEGIRKGLHTGGQMVVIHRGQECLNEAFGTMGPGGAPVTPQHQYLWMSSGKPLAAIAIAQLVERGQLTFQTRVEAVIPEFGNGGKEAVTVGHILSQSAAMRGADRIEGPTTESILERIYSLPLDVGEEPGKHAGYHVGGTWLVLGEILRRVSSLPVEEYFKKNLFQPLGMRDCSLGISEKECPEKLVRMLDTSRPGEAIRIHPVYGSEAQMRLARPGRNLIGSIRELARFYETLRQVLRGESDFLKTETLGQMVVSQRPAGMRDLTFGHPADFGYGFYLHPEKYGKGKTSYGYGGYASDATFGHSGAQSSCGFYDPLADLMVAWIVDGMPGEPKHQRRARAINEAVYLDLQYCGAEGIGSQ